MVVSWHEINKIVAAKSALKAFIFIANQSITFITTNKKKNPLLLIRLFIYLYNNTHKQ
jgi:hypothetical protein